MCFLCKTLSTIGYIFIFNHLYCGRQTDNIHVCKVWWTVGCACCTSNDHLRVMHCWHLDPLKNLHLQYFNKGDGSIETLLHCLNCLIDLCQEKLLPTVNIFFGGPCPNVELPDMASNHLNRPSSITHWHDCTHGSIQALWGFHACGDQLTTQEN